MRQRVYTSGRDDAAQTRRRLVAVGTKLFAERGFAEARIRDIAARANVNVAMIGYHFENKEGLYRAIIADISARMVEPLSDALNAARQALGEDVPFAANWNSIVVDLLISLHRVMLEEGVGDWSRIMLREQMDPSPFFDELHARVAEPFISTLANVLERRAQERGRAAERGTFLARAVMLMGQLLVFTSAKTSVERMLAPADMAMVPALVRSMLID